MKTRTPLQTLWFVFGVLFVSQPTATRAQSSAADVQDVPSLEAASDADVSALDDPDATPTSFTLYFENDGTFARPFDDDDGHYTSGQGFSVAKHRHGADGLFDGLGLPSDGTAVGVCLIQQMFTPESIIAPDPNDRPYAGYLYFGTFVQRQSGQHFDHLQLDLGVVGPSSGAEFNQEWVHDFFEEDDPDWDGQIGDEFAFNLRYAHKWRIPLGTSRINDVPFDWQLIPQVEAEIGNVYRRVGAGGIIRLGYNLPDDFGPSRLTDLASATGQATQGFSCYAFGRAIGRYNEWNTFIQGSNWRDPSPSRSLVPWTGEFGGGFVFAWRYRNVNIDLSYTLVQFTEEFREQTTTDGLGSLALRCVWAF